MTNGASKAVIREVTATCFTSKISGRSATPANNEDWLHSWIRIGPIHRTPLFEVKATDVEVLGWPEVTIFVVTLLSALPAIVRAVRIYPATMLRLE